MGFVKCSHGSSLFGSGFATLLEFADIVLLLRLRGRRVFDEEGGAKGSVLANATVSLFLFMFLVALVVAVVFVVVMLSL